MVAALLRALLVVGSLFLALVGSAAGEPRQDGAVFTATVSAPCAHEAADHASAAACPSGVAACWSHCPQGSNPSVQPIRLALPARPALIRSIPGSDQDHPARHLPPPKPFL
jgi:hypothetical protein